MTVVFGVKSRDLDEARRWVEAATGLVGRYADHMDMGGEYFEFGADLAEKIILQSNVDIITGKPFTSKRYEKWQFIVDLGPTDKVGRYAEVLLAAPTRFAFLGEMEL